jgi:prepilin-type N-terminal cleavage/methylation domain-containing protein/prepilin-type processing-associated H-X9-DG protein
MRKRTTGFTLVELLVVIGIIALLISILLPALNRARAAGQTVKCLSNLRQFAMANIMYANDNNGIVVFPRDQTNRIDGNDVFWFQFLTPYMGRNEMSRSVNVGGPAQIVRDCPAYQDDPADTAHNGYGMGRRLHAYRNDQGNLRGRTRYYAPWDGPVPNDQNLSDHNEHRAPWKLASIKHQTDRIIFGDSRNMWLDANVNEPHFDLTPGVKASGDPWRHRGRPGEVADMNSWRANYAFLDGHAETLGYLEAVRAMNEPNMPRR